ncbi:hypothetical protein EYZ11_007038 [Aspergillus tanneri]|uniref:Methyltransferase domain-containing protein n=1 Tax=Aspergillus tanneri TaxID=1220188 RepID=A0A4S3JEA7_9EURO|nr:uncharacterized protein ATNIH1004_000052 [Aspergillus tanneri]KAA8651174.1 hypothetical protein ATNIH1004_000052 [Aspergillus tanneri]THC93482.1 hypothetical protein EYZ11_007038 [Aspergillus tanneri]
MDNFMNMTKKAGHTAELQRLVDLHAVYDDAMDGKLVLAPIDLQEPGKRILDSGTADGTWLRGVRSSLSAKHHYFGSDVESELFPEQPDGITFFQHSFTEPWPEDIRNSFDLAHIRGSLAGSSPKKPIDVVKDFTSLVKPGGWVQLQEMNAFSPPSNGPAMTDFARMVSEVWTRINVGDFANELKSMLEEAGLQSVQERRIICEIGKTAKPELRTQSVNGVTGPVRPLTSVARGVPTSFNEEQLDTLPERVKAELESEGGRIEVIVAWGQRV